MDTAAVSCLICDIEVDSLTSASVQISSSLTHYFCSARCESTYYEPNPVKKCLRCQKYVVVKASTPKRTAEPGGNRKTAREQVQVFCDDNCLRAAIQQGRIRF